MKKKRPGTTPEDGGGKRREREREIQTRHAHLLSKQLPVLFCFLSCSSLARFWFVVPLSCTRHNCPLLFLYDTFL